MEKVNAEVHWIAHSGDAMFATFLRTAKLWFLSAVTERRFSFGTSRRANQWLRSKCIITFVTNYIERIAGEWRQRAPELAQWTMTHLVNRTDVWGRYLAKKHRTTKDGIQNNAITAPFRDERGKVFLNDSSLQKHFKTRNVGGVLGVHSSGSDGTARWIAIDIDLHDEEELSVTAEGNFVAAKGWFDQLQEMGLDPLLFDSNGRGGFHLVIVFAEPMDARNVRRFGDEFVSDFDKRGLDGPPEMFPGKFRYGHYGSWLRLPGRHHTHPHYTCVWNDEPWSDDKWLEGDEAVDRILRTRPASVELLKSLGIERRRKTICLDFDGVIHSYSSGWKGETVIPDPPIHRSREAIAKLRESFRIVVHSARCCSEEGCEAIRQWLHKHNIEVDEVCMFKPPATVYLDDRAVPFTGNWEQAISDINAFRR